MKVKFGAIVTEGRGKVGGHVFTRNPYANVLRTKKSPCQPNTTSQQLMKSRLTKAAQTWRGIGDAGRQGFESLAQNVSRTNVFGDSAKLSGFALFVRLNREIAEIGGTAITVAPAMPTMSSVTTLSLSAIVLADTFNITYAPTPVPTGFIMVIQASPQQSPGISFIGSKMRTLDVATEGEATPYYSNGIYSAKFGTLIATNRIFVRAKLVHVLTGFSSSWMQASTIVTAT